MKVATVNKEGLVQTADVVPTETQHWGTMWEVHSLSVELLVEMSDSNQTPYIPAFQKGPLLVLLLTDLPKLLGTHLFSLHIPFWDNKLHSQLAALKKDSFYLLSVMFVFLPQPCFSPHHHHPPPPPLTLAPTSDWASQECTACMGVGGGGDGRQRGVTHLLLSHLLYKVSRGPERGGAHLSAGRGSGRALAIGQGWDFSPMARICLMALACKQKLFREGGGGSLVPKQMGWVRAVTRHASPC